jgi:Sec-independent protein translocase protein TatA
VQRLGSAARDAVPVFRALRKRLLERRERLEKKTKTETEKKTRCSPLSQTR